MPAEEVQSKYEAVLGEGSVAFLSHQWLHFAGKSKNPVAAFSWPMSRQFHRLHATEKMSSTKSLVQPLLSFCALLFNVHTGTKQTLSEWKWLWLWWMHMCTLAVKRRKVQIIFNLVEKVTERKTYLQWKGTQPRCGSAASVSPGRGKSGPPRRPPELPQRRRRAAPGWQSASLQGRDTRRLERSIPTIARFTGRRCWIEPLCWQTQNKS